MPHGGRSNQRNHDDSLHILGFPNSTAPLPKEKEMKRPFSEWDFEQVPGQSQMHAQKDKLKQSPLTTLFMDLVGKREQKKNWTNIYIHTQMRYISRNYTVKVNFVYPAGSCCVCVYVHAMTWTPQWQPVTIARL